DARGVLMSESGIHGDGECTRRSVSPPSVHVPVAWDGGASCKPGFTFASFASSLARPGLWRAPCLWVLGVGKMSHRNGTTSQPIPRPPLHQKRQDKTGERDGPGTTAPAWNRGYIRRQG